MHRPTSSTPRRALGVAAAIAMGAGALFASSPAVAASTPPCQTSGLVVWLNTNANGAAGSLFYTLNFTNLSGRRCTLRGYPGVSAVSRRGRRLGRAANRNNFHKVKTISIGDGGTASTMVQIYHAADFPASRCQPATAAGLRVFPPNQSASKTVPFPFPACSTTRLSILTVMAVK
jgi:hypothetical protein